MNYCNIQFFNAKVIVNLFYSLGSEETECFKFLCDMTLVPLNAYQDRIRE